jgi:hypothetical protein
MEEKKLSIRDIVIKEQERLTILVDQFITIQNTIENKFDKFFSEILKCSKEFELKKNKRTYSKEIRYRHENGRYINVGCVQKDYNECSISYIGRLPDNVNNPFTISVQEHIVYGRSYWNKRNEGLKLVVRINYDKEIFYKTGKGLVKKINEEVQLIWDRHNSKLVSERKRELAVSSVSKKFGKCLVTNSDNSVITILFENSVNISLYYNSNLETGEVTFTLRNLNFGSSIKNESKLNDLIQFFSSI